jgi:hypothetical protein
MSDFVRLTDSVIAAWGHSASGPDWANQLVVVLVQSEDGNLRLEYLPPNELGLKVNLALFEVSESVNKALSRAATQALEARAKNG